jgi:hypothetical protein
MRLALAVFAVLGIAAMTPATASAQPVGVTAQQHFSYRAAFAPNQAMNSGFIDPPALFPYTATSGSQDWRKEPTINAFRLHSRFWADLGFDACLTGSGTSVYSPTCQPLNSGISQNWRLVTTGGISRVRHAGTGLYLTYPASAKGTVVLAPLSAVTTQGFIERNEGSK